MADVTKVKASDGTIYDINDVNDYTKEETDALLIQKADVGDSYTKAEDDALLAAKADTSSVDTALALKANVVDVYSKTEADNLLAEKADTGVSYTKAEDDALLADKADTGVSYTKAEDDALLAAKADASALADYVTVGAAEATYATKSTVAAITATMVNIQNDLGSTPLDTTAQNVHDAINELLAEIGGIKMFPLLDFANPLYTFPNTDITDYVVQESCYLFISTTNAASTNMGIIRINGTPITVSSGSYAAAAVPTLIRLAAGDTISTQSTPQNYGHIYLLKERS